MDNVVELRGPFDDAMLAALFADNDAPSSGEIEAAIRDAQVYAAATDKLIERAGVDPKAYANQQAIFGPLVRLLSLAGWTLSGSGYFSVAFHKGGLALKIGLKPEDDCALPYLEWCRDNDHLPGVPMLYALGREQHCYAVVMERYEPLCGELDEQSPLYEPSVQAEFEAVREGIIQGMYTVSFATSETACAIHHAFRGKSYFDVNENNLMLDRRMRLVITDPLGLPSGAYYPAQQTSGFTSS